MEVSEESLDAQKAARLQRKRESEQRRIARESRRISVRLPPWALKRLQTVCADEKITTTEAIIRAIRHTYAVPDPPKDE